MPASTHRDPLAERISPSFKGVSTPEEIVKARPITTMKHRINKSDFFNFCGLDARLIREKTTVTATVTNSIAIATDTKGETTP